jgi:uncharacterized lipoprotein YmbA
LGIVLLPLLGGCAKAPPPDFYLLAPQVPVELPGFESGVAVGLGPVELPPHLDRNQIVSRMTPSRLRLSEQHHWAEPLKVGFTRVLLITLGVELDSSRIYVLPTRQRRDLDFQVAVDVLRFDGQLGGEVELVARWTLLDGDSSNILSSEVAQIRVPNQGVDHEALVAAQSRAATELGYQIAAAIDRRR